MPKAKVLSDAERRIPVELLETRMPLGSFIVKSRLDRDEGFENLSADGRAQLRWQARLAVRNLGRALNLKRGDRFISVGAVNYHEHDAKGKEIKEHGLLAFFPVIEKASGAIVRSEEPAEWTDAAHPPVEPLTKDDIRLFGRVAMVTDALDGGWHAHRLSDVAITPRDELLAKAQAQEAQGLINVVPIRKGVENEAPVEELPLTGTA